MELNKLCLKWNNHYSNFMSEFEDFLISEKLADVTLACDGKFLKAHKVILSSCSPFFKRMFEENLCNHPVIVLNHIAHEDLGAIVDFMYRGEVNVVEEKMPSFLKTGEILQIKGLFIPSVEPTDNCHKTNIEGRNNRNNNNDNGVPKTSFIEICKGTDAPEEIAEEMWYENKSSSSILSPLLDESLTKSLPQRSVMENKYMLSNSNESSDTCNSSEHVLPPDVSEGFCDDSSGEQSSVVSTPLSIPVKSDTVVSLSNKGRKISTRRIFLCSKSKDPVQQEEGACEFADTKTYVPGESNILCLPSSSSHLLSGMSAMTTKPLSTVTSDTKINNFDSARSSTFLSSEDICTSENSTVKAKECEHPTAMSSSELTVMSESSTGQINVEDKVNASSCVEQYSGHPETDYQFNMNLTSYSPMRGRRRGRQPSWMKNLGVHCVTSENHNHMTKLPPGRYSDCIVCSDRTCGKRKRTGYVCLDCGGIGLCPGDCWTEHHKQNFQSL